MSWQKTKKWLDTPHGYSLAILASFIITAVLTTLILMGFVRFHGF